MLLEDNAFERKGKIIDLKEKLLIAEKQKLCGEKTTSIDSAYQRLKKIIYDK